MLDIPEGDPLDIALKAETPPPFALLITFGLHDGSGGFTTERYTNYNRDVALPDGRTFDSTEDLIGASFPLLDGKLQRAIYQLDFSDLESRPTGWKEQV